MKTYDSRLLRQIKSCELEAEKGNLHLADLQAGECVLSERGDQPTTLQGSIFQPWKTYERGEKCHCKLNLCWMKGNIRSLERPKINEWYHLHQGETYVHWVSVYCVQRGLSVNGNRPSAAWWWHHVPKFLLNPSKSPFSVIFLLAHLLLVQSLNFSAQGSVVGPFLCCLSLDDFAQS